MLLPQKAVYSMALTKHMEPLEAASPGMQICDQPAVAMSKALVRTGGSGFSRFLKHTES